MLKGQRSKVKFFCGLQVMVTKVCKKIILPLTFQGQISKARNVGNCIFIRRSLSSDPNCEYDFFVKFEPKKNVGEGVGKMYIE